MTASKGAVLQGRIQNLANGTNYDPTGSPAGAQRAKLVIEVD